MFNFLKLINNAVYSARKRGDELSKSLTPQVLADELNVSAKTLRAWLRKNTPRELEQKSTAWAISKSAAAKARKHFTR